jgi:hypothetical protein
MRERIRRIGCESSEGEAEMMPSIIDDRNKGIQDLQAQVSALFIQH